MTKIASDAMVIQLAIDMAGDGEVKDRLARLNDFVSSINAKTAADTTALERMAVEGRYNPDTQRDYEIEKAIQLTEKLNLSLQTQDAILAEILDKHQKAIAAQHQQYSQHNMPGDDMVAAYRKNQEDQLAAEAKILNDKKEADKEAKRLNNEFLADKERAARVTQKLLEDEMSNYERYVARVRAAQDEMKAGIIDKKGFELRAEAARKDYKEQMAIEVERALLLEKRVENEKEAARDIIQAQQLQAYNESIESRQRKARAAIDAQIAADNEANAARQKAVNLLHSLEDATQRYTRVSDELRAHLDAGDITNEQYAQGLANIERRQRAMAGGANNVAYAIGNTVTGLEDFVTVLSITGFGMEGFSAATRSASNNVAQAVRSLGTETAAIAAPLISIGMVLAGSAIPYIYKYITATEDAEAATRRWSREIETAVRLAGEMGRLEIRRINFEAEVTDIRKMDDSEAVKERYNDLAQKEKILLAEIQKGLKESEAAAAKLFDRLVPTSTVQDFNDYVNSIGQEFGADVEAGFRLRLKDMQSEFVRIAVEKDAEEARKVLLSRMKAMQQDMETMRPGSSTSTGLSRIVDLMGMGQDTAFANDFVNIFPELINDATVLDQIQELEGKIVELSREDSKAARLKKEELIETRDLLKELHDQYLKALDAEATKAAEVQAQAQHLDQQLMESDLEKLRIQQRKNSLLGEENEAERKILDLALRRREIMESGIAAPDVLAGLFNAELEAIAAELEKQIAKAEELIYSTASMTEPEAYTSANKQIMEAMKEDDPKQQEMIDLLKAIKDHLSGAATLQVEVM